MDPRHAAAAFERLLEHLRERPQLQNIELMNLAGFCRNCLADWYREAAQAAGEAIDKDQARTLVYGEPYEQWKARNQLPMPAAGHAAAAGANPAADRTPGPAPSAG